MPPYSAAGAAATRQAAVPMASPAEQAYNSLCYDFPVSGLQTYAVLVSDMIFLGLNTPHNAASFLFSLLLFCYLTHSKLTPLEFGRLLHFYWILSKCRILFLFF